MFTESSKIMLKLFKNVLNWKNLSLCESEKKRKRRKKIKIY